MQGKQSCTRAMHCSYYKLQQVCVYIDLYL
jgi:hypothetical protein